MKCSVLGLALSCVLSSGSNAQAQVPGVDYSIVPKAVCLSPTGALAYSVTIIDGNQHPVVGVPVEVRFNAPGDTLTCWCGDVPDPGPYPATHSFFATTNNSGVAVFHIRGGGCIEYALTVIPGPWDVAGEIFVSGFIKMSEFGTVSPDAVDLAGRLPTSPASLWNPAGICGTGLADAVQHTTPLATSVYQWCTDMNSDKQCNITDAMILTPFIAGAASCPGDAGATP